MKPEIAITAARIRRCGNANNDTAIRMRHCESCEVAIGTMSRKAFDKLKKCKACGKPIHVDCVEDVPEVWINQTDAKLIYGVGSVRLARVVREGRVRINEAGRGILMAERDLVREFG